MEEPVCGNLEWDRNALEYRYSSSVKACSINIDASRLTLFPSWVSTIDDSEIDWFTHPQLTFGIDSSVLEWCYFVLILPVASIFSQVAHVTQAQV